MMQELRKGLARVGFIPDRAVVQAGSKLSWGDWGERGSSAQERASLECRLGPPTGAAASEQQGRWFCCMNQPVGADPKPDEGAGVWVWVGLLTGTDPAGWAASPHSKFFAITPSRPGLHTGHISSSLNLHPSASLSGPQTLACPQTSSVPAASRVHPLAPPSLPQDPHISSHLPCLAPWLSTPLLLFG